MYKNQETKNHIKFGAMAAILLQVNDTIHGTDALYSVLHGDLAGFYRGRKLQTKNTFNKSKRGKKPSIFYSPRLY